MVPSYEARLIIERMEKEIRFLKALLNNNSAATENWIGLTPEMVRSGEPIPGREGTL